MALFDAFLKLDGIKGESADAKHKGEIDIMSFSFDIEQTGTLATGGGGGAGKVKVHDISFSKKTDASSPLLMLNCANGAHIKQATFVVRKAGGEQLEFLKIKLTDVLVSSYKPFASILEYQLGGSHGGSVAHVGGGSGAAVYAYDWHESASSPTGGSGGEIPMEYFALNFSKIEYAYQTQGADGKAQGGPIVAGWDVKANQKV